MNLMRAVSCWGNVASPMEALRLANEWGFEAVEGPLPEDPADFSKAASDSGKAVFVEISTGCPAGIYVPSLSATPTDHLEDFRRKLDAALPLDPKRITVLAGADFWDFSTACKFYGELLEIARTAGTEICVETHRSRPTFHPILTARLLAELPDLRLTLDVSHWCVVCERAVATISEWMEPIEPRVGHLHARVGYDQGPQTPDPDSPWHCEDLSSHLDCWKRIASFQETLTVTPEFGPDGYLHIDPRTGAPVADLRVLNRRMGERLKLELEKPV
jgi:sugar phosphate isomerase/epimerase